MKIDAEHDFGMRECPGCGCEVPANENRCPICRYVFPVRSGAMGRLAPWVAWALIGLGVAALAWGAVRAAAG